jgi:predicted ATP-binding protein involved in virulence
LQNRLQHYENTESDRYGKIIDCLVSLLPEVKDLEVRSSDIEAVFMDGSRAPFSSLSDGYLTTAAWVLDMIAAWIDTHPAFEGDPRPIAEQMTGFALVDEIDLHLHPIWQRSVVNQIRTAFPNMSFIVTTHSPLTILDAKPGELFVVDQPSMGEPSLIRQVDLRPGNVDDILTGSWFKLNTTLDTETAQMMEQHRQLLAEGAEPQDPRVESLEAELGKRLDGFGGSSVDRIVQSVANEVLTENLETMSEDKKDQARQTLLEAVRKQVKGDQA